MIQLRDYQDRGANQIRAAFAAGKRAPLYVAPTGSGKTRLFAYITHGAAQKGNRVMLVAHRIELVDQISDALTDTGTYHTFIAANYPQRLHQTMVASIQTLVRRASAIPPPDLLILDEAHHAVADTWQTLYRLWPKTKILGVTATPARPTGAGLGTVFDEMILGPTVPELIAAGYLAPPRMFAPPTMDASALHMRAGDYVQSEAEALANRPSVTGSALAEYQKRADNRRALVFCTSVAHAYAVAEQFRAAGYAAIALDGNTDRLVRRHAVDDFKRGAIRVMTSADLFSEGFDSPGVEVGILLRPTASLPLYLQQVGRILRPAEGKAEALIFDHAGNCMRHGMPDEVREWSLNAEASKKSERKESCRTCPQCWAANQMRARECFECHTVFPVKSREVEQRDGELVELTAEKIAKRRERQNQGMAQTLEDLIRIEKSKKYRPGWALRVFTARQAKKRADDVKTI